MSEELGTKVVVIYAECPGRDPILGSSESQDLTKPSVCATCPRRFAGYEEVGRLLVGLDTKADEGSKERGLKTLDGKPVCLHPARTERIDDSGDLPEVSLNIIMERLDPIGAVDRAMEANRIS